MPYRVAIGKGYTLQPTRFQNGSERLRGMIHDRYVHYYTGRMSSRTFYHILNFPRNFITFLTVDILFVFVGPAIFTEKLNEVSVFVDIKASKLAPPSLVSV